MKIWVTVFILRLKGTYKKNIYQDRTFQAASFDTILIKINLQIRELFEFKYLKTTIFSSPEPKAQGELL